MASSSETVDEARAIVVRQAVYNVFMRHRLSTYVTEQRLVSLLERYITPQTLANNYGMYITTALIAVGRILEQMSAALNDAAIVELMEALTHILGNMGT